MKFSILLQTVLVTALTVLVGGVLLKFVIDGIYNDSFARFFVDALVFLNINEKTAIHLYWKLVGDNKTFYMIVGYLILFALFFYVALSQMTKYLDQIDHGIENIISESTDPIHLITELKPIEIRLNEIKATLKRQELEATEGEKKKNDLVLFLAHDLKTPLTSIINYVDLLKRLKITEEPAKSYIAVLDSKSQRLKQLTDDLVEASKISSGNIVLNLEPLNLTELLNQAVGEFSDRLEEKKLQIIFDGSDVVGMIYADSRRMWRIIENLFQNICKYALEGTRVYLEMKVEGGRVTASLKNISDRPMNLKGEELSERFIRGDASRTTEGSGLGLYIAKNLTQAQHGEFQIQLDGDLFKIILDFPEYESPSQEETAVLVETIEEA